MNDVPPPFDNLLFLAIIGFIIGTCLGSFATMLSYRLPRKLSIVDPPSHCPKCKATLNVADLVPVLSWITGGGKCRHCGNKIGIRYLWIELAAGTACAIAMMILGFQPAAFMAFTAITGIVTAITIHLERK